MPTLNQVLVFAGVPVVSAVCGFAGGFAKDAVLQYWRGRQERDNRLHAGGVEHRVDVSRIQFETEFESLKKVWAALAEARSAVYSSRPIFEYVNKDEALADRLLRKHSAIVTSVNKLATATDSVEPFIPEEVYSKALEARGVCRRELTQLEQVVVHKLDPDQDWYATASKHRGELDTVMSAAAVEIRVRLASLRIVAE